MGKETHTVTNARTHTLYHINNMKQNLMISMQTNVKLTIYKKKIGHLKDQQSLKVVN